MTVHVRKLSGPFFDLTLAGAATVGELKAAIKEETGQTVKPYQLSFEGRWLNEDGWLVAVYGVTEDSTLVLIGP